MLRRPCEGVSEEREERVGTDLGVSGAEVPETDGVVCRAGEKGVVLR